MAISDPDKGKHLITVVGITPSTKTPSVSLRNFNIDTKGAELGPSIIKVSPITEDENLTF